MQGFASEPLASMSSNFISPSPFPRPWNGNDAWCHWLSKLLSITKALEKMGYTICIRIYIYIIYNFCILHITYIFYISVHLCIRDQIGMRRYQTSYRTCQYHWFCSYSDWMVSKSRILSTATESSLASAHVLQHSAGSVCLICPGYYSAMLPPK